MSRLRRQGNMPSSQSFHHAPFPPPLQPCIRSSNSSMSLGYPPARAAPGNRGHIRSSRTWTSSSGDARQSFPEAVEKDADRTYFMQEYNRLAKKHGLRTLIVDEAASAASSSHAGEKRHWFSRMLRSTSREPPPPEAPKPPPLTRSKRSISDLAYHLMNTHTGVPRRIDLQSMVRLSGKSILYLPPEFTPESLVLPTCLRAVAQHLVQHAATRGIFRIPGSSRVVTALFDYYCFTGPTDADIASTVRCANLPLHIQSSVHDVASTFKRFLSVIPGGILGSLSTFDALVAIHSQLRGDPEFPRTKQTKVRSRLIALIINATATQLQRNLICAVFGLLSLIGRIAETTPREDDRGRPLPTSDLMGYSALGIVFGPLLVGDLLDQYTMKLATPSAGLMLLPLSPRKTRHHHKPPSLPDGIKGAMAPTVNKILVANDIVQMIIMNWRDIVRQLRCLANDSAHDIATISQNGSLIRKHSRGRNSLQPQIVSSNTRPTQHGAGCVPSPGYEGSIRRQKDRPTSRSSGRNSTAKPNHRQPNIVALSPTLEEDFLSTDQLPESSLGQITEAEWQQLQEIGCTTPPMNTDSVMPKRRKRLRTTLDSQRVSSSSVPPRISSKRDTHSPTPTFPENLSPSPRGRCLNSAENGCSQQLKRSEPSRSRSVSSRRPERRREPTESNQQRGSTFHSGHMSPHSGIERLDTCEETATTETHLLECTPNASDSGSGSAWSKRKHLKKSQELPTEVPRPPLSPVQNGGRAQSPRSQKVYADSGNRTSAFHASQQMCSPMRVPPDLTAHAQEASNASYRPGGWKPQNKVAHKGRMRSLTGSPKSIFRTPEKVPHNSRSFVVSASSTADPQTNIRHEANKGDQSHQTKLPPLKTGPDPALSEIKSQASFTEAVSQHSGVRAMVAKFDTARALEAVPGSKRESMQKLQLNTGSGSDHKNNSLRNSKSGPLPNTQKAQRGFWANPLKVPPKDNLHHAEEQRDESARQSVAQRAAAIMKAESMASSTLTANKDSANMTRRPVSLNQDVNVGDAQTLGRQPPSLGTMIPHQEEPPIAQHINFSRPSSVISVVVPDADPQLISEGTPIAPTPRSGATSILHHQIRTLQKQLDLKIEEVAQLRRQLEAQGTSEIGTLSEQLREAKRESRMWKDRAEAAERRVQVFERFTARLKGIREAATVADEHHAMVNEGDDDTSRGDSGQESSSDGSGPSEQAGKLLEKVGKTGSEGSGSSGITEDAGVMTARIRKCLHGGRRSKDEARESEASNNEGHFGADGATSEVESVRGISGTIANSWLIAKEFLDNEEEG